MPFLKMFRSSINIYFNREPYGMDGDFEDAVQKLVGHNMYPLCI